MPRQFVFDHLLEQHGSQSELFDLIGTPTVNAALNGGVATPERLEQFGGVNLLVLLLAKLLATSVCVGSGLVGGTSGRLRRGPWPEWPPSASSAWRRGSAGASRSAGRRAGSLQYSYQF